MLRVIGAGFGRTGTQSLQVALEQLLGGPCYHMKNVIARHPEHIETWRAAARGDAVDWERLFDGYVAAVDWPVARFYKELLAIYPDAKFILSRSVRFWACRCRTARFHMSTTARPSVEPYESWPRYPGCSLSWPSVRWPLSFDRCSDPLVRFRRSPSLGPPSRYCGGAGTTFRTQPSPLVSR